MMLTSDNGRSRDSSMPSSFRTRTHAFIEFRATPRHANAVVYAVCCGFLFTACAWENWTVRRSYWEFLKAITGGETGALAHFPALHIGRDIGVVPRVFPGA